MPILSDLISTWHRHFPSTWNHSFPSFRKLLLDTYIKFIDAFGLILVWGHITIAQVLPRGLVQGSLLGGLSSQDYMWCQN